MSHQETRFKDLKNNEKFNKKIAAILAGTLHTFLKENPIENFGGDKLEKILVQYQKGLFK